MKRLILLATMMVAVLASCEKHEIRNEVLNEIGFASNVGKQTKAIYSGSGAFTGSGFGMISIGKQGDKNAQTVMDNILIAKTGNDWVAKSGTKYYWPNNDDTKISFFGYYPYTGNEAADAPNHEKINATNISASYDGYISITGYQHTNMYVDMMIADKVNGATFKDKDGNGTADANETTPYTGEVPVVFHHVMSQIIFTAELTQEYNGITYTLENITLNNIQNTGSVSNLTLTATAGTTTNYTVYPAKMVGSSGDDYNLDGAPNLSEAEGAVDPNSSKYIGIKTVPYVVNQVEANHANQATSPYTTQAVTMIPQSLSGKSITVVYTISGTGVATETVEKTINFGTNDAWVANKRYTYKLTIGMNEIKFTPTVIGWEEYDHDPNTNGNQPYPIPLQ